CLQRFTPYSLSGRGEMNVRGAAGSPCAAARLECARRLLHERTLLIWSELDHSPAFVWITKRGEDLSIHPKIRVVHVLRLDRPGHFQRRCSEFVSVHFHRS